MMTHPLTDEICDSIAPWAVDDDCEYECMRTAAEWQLIQVLEWIPKFGWYLFEHPCQQQEFISELKKAMRPQQLEDN